MKITEKMPLPPIIRKNISLFIAGFGFFFIAFEIGLPLYAKAALEITGKKELVGLPLALSTLAAIFSAIPLGKMADKAGRKLGVILSALVLGSGFIVAAWGISVNSWSIYLFGNILIGLGLGGNPLFVLAVTDMFPPKRKGEASGLAFLGLYVGTTIGPFLGGVIAGAYGFTYAFLAGSVFAVLGVIILLLVSPDPLEIGTHLEKYYPEFEEESRVEEKKEIKIRSIPQIFRLYPIQVQFWSRILVHAPRLFLIVLAPIVLTEIGYSMAWVGTLIMVMGIGMFAVSFPMGRLADKYGRKKIIFGGALISLLSIAAEVYTMNMVLLGIIFLAIGFGFTAINNVSPIMVADVTHPLERGKAMGFFGIAGAAGGIVFPVLSGWVFGTFGPLYVGWVGAGIVLVILFLLIPLREKTPGVYDNAGARPEDIPR